MSIASSESVVVAPAVDSCPHFTAPNQCAVAMQLSGLPTISILSPAACRHCTEVANPSRSVNEVTVSLACTSLTNQPDARNKLLANYGYHLRREYPTWTAQAWAVATAVTDWLANGAHGVTREVYEGRLATCDGCPNRDGHRCKLCGCFVRGKASLPTENCPIGLWK